MRPLRRWKPVLDLDAMQRRLEDMLDRFTERFFGPAEGGRSTWRTKSWTPTVASHVEDGTLVLKAALPGIDPQDVSVSVLRNQLTIEGARKPEEANGGRERFSRERAYGRFSCTVTLPEGVDGDKVKARYKDGVLEITMPTPKPLTRRKIPIEVQT
jgi:HSP20 family protein